MGAAGAAMALQGAGQLQETVGNVQAIASQRKSLKEEAVSVEQQAAFDEAQQRRQNRLMLGEATAIGAASGVEITSGSPLLHELDRITQTEIQAQNIRVGAQNKVNAINFQRKMLKRQVAPEIAGGITKGGGSILSTYANRR